MDEDPGQLAALGTLFQRIMARRKELAAEYTTAREALKATTPLIKFGEAIEAIKARCGSGLDVNYPDHHDLGVSVETFASESPDDQAEVTRAIEPFVASALKQKGHIDLILKTCIGDSQIAEENRGKAAELVDKITELRVKIALIDQIQVFLLSDDAVDVASFDEFAEKLCAIGESEPQALTAWEDGRRSVEEPLPVPERFAKLIAGRDGAPGDEAPEIGL